MMKKIREALWGLLGGGLGIAMFVLLAGQTIITPGRISLPVSVANGGTGTGSTLSGYLKGGSPLTAQATPIPVADGGTGTGSTLSGYLKGGSPLTAQATPIPAADLGTGSTASTFLRGDQTYQPVATVPDRVATDTTVVSTTSETTVYTKSIPANTLSTSVKLRLTIIGTMQGLVGTTSAFTIRCKYGATTLTSDTWSVGDTVNTSLGANTPWKMVFELAGDTATNAQLGNYLAEGFRVDTLVAKTFNMSTVRGTSAIDSTAAQNLVVTVQPDTNSTTVKFVMEHALQEQL